MNIAERKTTIAGIPIVLAAKDDCSRKPLVLLCHGFRGSKEDFIRSGLLQELAELGYCSVAMDNRYHGDRVGPGFDKVLYHSSGTIDLVQLRQAMKDTADDVKLLIDEMISFPEVDESRIAVLGVSMGGFITYRAIVIDSRITVGIPIISSPYWNDIPGDLSIDEETSDVKLRAISETCQPAEYPDRFFPTAVLMQIGDADAHYSKDKISVFYNKVAAYYTEYPERLRLIRYPNTKHEFTREMREQAVGWLRKYL